MERSRTRRCWPDPPEAFFANVGSIRPPPMRLLDDAAGRLPPPSSDTFVKSIVPSAGASGHRTRDAVSSDRRRSISRPQRGPPWSRATSPDRHPLLTPSIDDRAVSPRLARFGLTWIEDTGRSRARWRG